MQTGVKSRQKWQNLTLKLIPSANLLFVTHCLASLLVFVAFYLAQFSLSATGHKLFSFFGLFAATHQICFEQA